VTTEIVPLCVDLDGTLLQTDLLWESAFQFLRNNPARFFDLVRWTLQGRAQLKRQLALNSGLDVALLPLNEPLVEWLRLQKSAGRPLILCTAADQQLALQIADRVDLFEEVLASDGHLNLKGSKKAALLYQRFGNLFDYAGNSLSDQKIWNICRNIIAVRAPWWLIPSLRKTGRLEATFSNKLSWAFILRRTLRMHQWSKNVLIFTPLLASHRLYEPGRLRPVLLSAIAFSLIASATYMANDLLDLTSDRRHSRKRFRPLAGGDFPLSLAVPFLLLLAGAGIGLSILTANRWVPLLVAGYALTSLTYSAFWKRKVLVDVFALSGFYTLRVILGGVAAGVAPSGWFLSFSVFLFLSLGLAKRATELYPLLARTEQDIPIAGRGYRAADFLAVFSFGVAATFSSILVLALYLRSPEVRILYKRPEILMGLFPLVLFWLMRVWMKAGRGELHDDPIIFALKDRLTWLLGAVGLLILWSSAVL